jgi:hypothetical protein
MAVALGPNPSQELFRFAAYATSMLMFGLEGEKALSCNEIKLCYNFEYLEGQTWTPYCVTVVPAATGDARPVPLEASQASCDEVDSEPPLRKEVSTPHNPQREGFVLQQ